MRKWAKFLIFLVVIFLTTYSAQAHNSRCRSLNKNLSINFKGDTLVIKPAGKKDQILITNDYRLFLNGNEIKLNKDQQDLVRDYYEQVRFITATALKLIPRGAEIGIDGAKLGLKAILHTVLTLDKNYDEEQGEKKLEESERALERKASDLEKKGKNLEKIGDELEALQCQLFHQIKELHPFLQ